MKKTLIILSSLGAISALADDLTLVGSYTESTLSGGVESWTLGERYSASTSTNYAIVYQLDIDAFKTALEQSTLINHQIVGVNYSNYGFAIRDNGALAFSTNGIGNSVSTYWSLSPTQTLSSSWLTNNGSDLVGATIVFSTGISFTGNTTTGTAGFSLLYADGTIVDYLGTNAGFRTGGLSFNTISAMEGLVDAVYLYSGSPADVASTTVLASTAHNYLQIAVPEPATATLSLLALAGLAARRRRKS